LVNLLTTCPVSVEVKKESGAFSTMSSKRLWRLSAERGINLIKSVPVKTISVTMAANSTARRMPR
jgi:hypothetical protein